MKNVLFKILSLILFFLLIENNSRLYAQFFICNFENQGIYKPYFYIDSTNPNNVWQIGKPQKLHFDTAYTQPNALITDTINTYPSNNSSSVIIWQKIDMPVFAVDFYYRVNSDTLSDLGLFEFSADMGSTWIAISEWFGTVPVFSGDSHGWRRALSAIGTENFGLHIGDTILFRFTFTSDNIDTHKDGWMIDNITIHQCLDIGIDEQNNSNNFQVFYGGNNTIEIIQDKFQNSKNLIFELYNNNGSVVFSKKLNSQKSNIFQISKPPAGIYFYQIFDSNNKVKSGKISIN